MIFSSYEFMLFFLPITLGVYYWLGLKQQFRVAIAWLVAASLFFYGWWNPAYLGLIIGSIFFNYSLGVALSGQRRSKPLLVFGIAANLALLGYYKYTNFLITNINTLMDAHLQVQDIILPLGISFFTFTQIAYLVDAWRGETREYNFMQYTLFVTFFPHLIAGPVVHHRDLLPQFTRHIIQQINATNLMAGSSILFIGLFKKVMLADPISAYVAPLFSAVEHGLQPTLFEAWGGALAYTLQLYFDFSGYADMAIGISMMFGVLLPLNFNSPYKSTSIIEFWRRWHMTLSSFLRDYLYIALGGNRKGKVRRHVNLMATMLLGGLWHGAGWTFVIWGGLHGVFLVINHLWRELCRKLGFGGESTLPGRVLAATITFLCVVVAWVFFRAQSVHGAMAILNGMVGHNGVTVPIKYEKGWGDFAVQLKGWGVTFDDNLFDGGRQLGKIVIYLLIVWCLPNSQTLMRDYKVTTDKVVLQASRLVFKPNWFWLLFIYGIAVTSILHLGGVSEFLYFQF